MIKSLSCPIVVGVIFLIAATAHAGPVKYEFEGSVNVTTAAISGWFSIGTLPTDTSTVPGEGSYFVSGGGSATPFLSWEVKVGSDTFQSLPVGDFLHEGIFVRDRGSSDTDPDNVLITSTYSDATLAISLRADDYTAFSGVEVPNLEAFDWDKISIKFIDMSVDPYVVYVGEISKLTLVPVPPAALLGLGLLGVLGLARRLKRRR